MQSAITAAVREDVPHPKECRICRQPGDAEMPLFRCESASTPFPAPFFEMRLNRYFRPCRCDGSIRYVHEACLEQWISRKRTSHCEVCTYPIRFEQVVQGSTGQGLRLRLFSNYVLKFAPFADNLRSWQLSLGIAKRFARHSRQLLWCFFVAAVWGIILPLFTNALFNM